MSTPYRIAYIGLDTSHVVAFTKLLHNTDDQHHVAGARLVAAFPGGSPDLDVSINRVEGFTNTLKETYQTEIVESIAALEGKADAIFLESVDGRVHLEQFREVADWGLPVFIDKPLTVSSAQAREILELAKAKNVRVMTASAIRYAQPFQEALADAEGGAIAGADVYGPMAFVEKLPGYFWYGIHSADMLFAAMGSGCQRVTARREGPYDVVVGEWADGRFGTMRGSRTGNSSFGGTLHREKRSRAYDVSTSTKPYYACLLEQILAFLGGSQPVALEESVEIIRFLEAANESVETGKTVAL